jgi:phosphoribosyl 1,2-cyclic phosphodiesterase/FixJ family two-component response regulator
LRVEFWGTRGSIPTPGPGTMRYGGNTACVEIRSARGTLVVLDCGTGAHPLGQKLIGSGTQGLHGHVLISHTHWDHIQGIPFFAPLFAAGSKWDVYGPKGLGQSLRETLAGQMQYTYFPVTLDQFEATVRYHDLVEGTFVIDDIKISTHYLNHSALTFGYRLEADGMAVVYCCDHEPYARTLGSGQGEITGQDLRHAQFIEGADLLIHDGQYTADEYPAKVGWGHSSIDYALRLGQEAGVKRLALTHHDPLRDDDALDRLVEKARTKLHRESRLEVFAAAEGQVIELKELAVAPREDAHQQFAATATVEPALVERSVLLHIADPATAGALSNAIRAEGLRPLFVSDIHDLKRMVLEDRPSLALVEHDPPLINGMAACRAIRLAQGQQSGLPVVVIAARQDSAFGEAAGVTDWLIKPFSESFIRTKVRAWVLRTACRWMRAGLPEDEEQRLASLRALKVLDTPLEDRFDRITRLAAALFNVPVALVSLVDENRQWFKSRHGLEVPETSRDSSFCAHVVCDGKPMIVPDTFQDPRFADNPLVLHEPRIRFYAGAPLILEDGSCVGSLCLIDTRPRLVAETDLARLHDLTDLAVQELERG